MRRPAEEARRWLLQAENDLAFARVALREGFFAQACFVCQQAGEKALKALAYALGERVVLGHSLFQLLDRLSPAYPGLVEFREAAGLLDQYYVATRYPNGLPDAVPYQVYTQSQAAQALQLGQDLLTEVRTRLGLEGTGR